jgi:hypothetical protein
VRSFGYEKTINKHNTLVLVLMDGVSGEHLEKPALGTIAVAMTHDQRSDHQLRIIEGRPISL